MKFLLNRETLQNQPMFYQEEEAYRGVNKIADKVMDDIEKVFGYCPRKTSKKDELSSMAVIYGTLGKSTVIDELCEQKRIDVSDVKDKREVYQIQLVNNPFEEVKSALVIVGSDKRGTIYGLFEFSRMLGVSPLVNWCDVKPQHLDEKEIEENYYYISKEPSVRYRGFFINDEWPAFGNWCNHRFGGFNAKAYEEVFELLLRLKGNYLWPAMWSARFQDDGPGLWNAKLADEYGVVMGMSHHEPCLRQGEEYKYLRGKDSIYGDAWNFITNREGITRFWEDGLKRSGQFENVITVGMRGEADTAIMGKNATLEDNINLLRDVLKTQNRLIKENVNEDLTKVPRMLALYKEVEPFFYGDAIAKGLMGDPELNNVILMLCDDNYGNLRTLPTSEMRKHKGGYGMYYHFDYHGWPVSFEWVNSSYLPKIWEQMTMAYDFGVRELWIVNVGDICTQEFPLSYFLDLAYDFDAWGTNKINTTKDYTKQWIDQQFSVAFAPEDREEIYEILDGYTKIAHKRRPEAMNAEIYHPMNYREADHVLETIDELLNKAQVLYDKVNKEHLPAYVSLVYYPAVANLNLQKLQILAGKNHYFAKMGSLEANKIATQMKVCLERDTALVNEYHEIDHEKWYGMGLSEHIGFKNWNEEECQKPIVMTVFPANKPRLAVAVDGVDEYTEGGDWTKKTLYLNDFKRPDAVKGSFIITSLSEQKASYQITTDVDWLTLSKTEGYLDGKELTLERIWVSMDREKSKKYHSGTIQIKTGTGNIEIIVNVEGYPTEELESMTFLPSDSYLCMEAEHYARKVDVITEQGINAGFQIIEDYGKTLSAVKVFPTTINFENSKECPYVEYQFVAKEVEECVIELYMQPSNPVDRNNQLFYGLQLNDGDRKIVNVIPEGLKVGDNSEIWGQGVLNNIRRNACSERCKAGLNTLRIYAISPGFVLEKIVIYKKGIKPAESYLGPTESYYVSRSYEEQ
ncbi:MAG: glycosyl hydrolase 115 family protein [Clostridiales bacterium]|nr:glycosyl hydrolase 115 family protein [Clostridiales bacterium]